LPPLQTPTNRPELETPTTQPATIQTSTNAGQ
jgi:hypothetical protein